MLHKRAIHTTEFHSKMQSIYVQVQSPLGTHELRGLLWLLCVCPLRTQVNVKLEILTASDLVFMFGRFPHNHLLSKLAIFSYLYLCKVLDDAAMVVASVTITSSATSHSASIIS